MSKKVLIFGNKPLDKKLTDEQIKFINSFDIIVRLNKMDNLYKTGGRVDWYFFHYWIKYANTSHIKESEIRSIKKLFMTSQTPRYVDRGFGPGDNFIAKCNNYYRYLSEDVEIDEITGNPYRYLDWIPNTYYRTIPTSLTILISYLVNEYSDGHDFWLTQCDLENRYTMMSENMPWKRYHHKYVGQLEENYIKNLIKEKRLSYLVL